MPNQRLKLAGAAMLVSRPPELILIVRPQRGVHAD